MQEFLKEKGWTFAGTCACTPKYDIYIHVNHKQWSIYVNGNSFKFKQAIMPGNNSTKVMAGLNDFKGKYAEYFGD